MEFLPFAAIGGIIAYMMGAAVRSLAPMNAISNYDIRNLPRDIHHAMAQIHGYDGEPETEVVDTGAFAIIRGTQEETENALLELARNGKPVTCTMERRQFQNLMQYIRDPRFIVHRVREGFLHLQVLNIFGENAPTIDLSNLDAETIGQFISILFKSESFVVHEAEDFKTVKIHFQPRFIRALLTVPENRRQLTGEDLSSWSTSETETESEETQSEESVESEETEQEEQQVVERTPTFYSETDEDDEIIVIKPVEKVAPVDGETPIAPVLGENNASHVTVPSAVFAAATLLTLVFF